MNLSILLLLAAGFANTSHAAGNFSDLSDCTPTTDLNTPCTVNVENLRPTQFSVGMIVVKQKEVKIKAKSTKKYQKYLVANPVPVVVGNGGQFYMVDKHHMVRAVYDIGNTVVVAQVIKDLNNLSGSDFWAEMTTEGLYYDRDENDQVQPYTALPAYIQDMADDPYRSISGAVRDAGGYQNLTSPLYLEFLWAHFYHQLDASYGITLDNIQSDFNGTVAKALVIAHSSLAAQLPGYSATPVKNN